MLSGASSALVSRAVRANTRVPSHPADPDPPVTECSGNLCAPVLAARRRQACVLCFCTFASFFFLFFFSSLFHKDTYSPSPPQGFTLDTAKERPGKAGRLGRGSSHKMRCVALCVPFVIPCTMNCPGHPPAPGYTQVPHLPCSPMGQWGELGMLLAGWPRAQSLCSGKGKFGQEGDHHVPAAAKSPLASPPAPEQSTGGSLWQNPSISPALMAFNMLMTLKRAGAALCKTHVLHSVMDVCARHGVKYLSPLPPPDSTGIDNSDRDWPLPPRQEHVAPGP